MWECHVRFHQGLVHAVKHKITLMPHELPIDERIDRVEGLSINGWWTAMKDLDFIYANGRSSRYTSMNMAVDKGFMLQEDNPTYKQGYAYIYRPTQKILTCPYI